MSSQRRGFPSFFVVVFLSLFLVPLSTNVANASNPGSWKPGPTVQVKAYDYQAETYPLTFGFTPESGSLSWSMDPAFEGFGWSITATASCGESALGGFSGVYSKTNTPTFSVPVSSCTNYRLRVYGSHTADTYIDWTYDIEEVTSPPADVSLGECSLSDDQLVLLARSAGFAESEIPTAVAIALAESGSKVNAVNFNETPPSYDLGLWQINDVAHPSYDRNSLVKNPLYNATAAREIYVAATGWTPWATFNNSAYVKFMTRANGATANSPGVLPMIDCSGALGNPSDPDNNGDVADDHCSGWNPLVYIKCALKWAFVPSDASFSQWTTLEQNSKTKPPLSAITGAIDYVQLVTGAYGECDTGQSSTGPTNCGNRPAFTAELPSDQNGVSRVYSFDPFEGAEESTETGYSDILLMIRLMLWVGFFLFAFHRISKSFGSKDDDTGTI